jgi:1-phosphatidylinositol-4-phosphate 5-kinase
MRFSIQNIPRKYNPAKSEFKKSKKNTLKAADFKLLLNIIMGIQLAVQSTSNHRIDDKEDIEGYLNKMIYSIQTTSFGLKKQEYFYITEVAGVIFNNIRQLYGINKDNYISSIHPQNFITEIMISSTSIIEELCSTGKSGSLFYYTRDGKYIIKTISNTEYQFLKKILPNYFNHLRKNPNTLLPKFFGCYKLVQKIRKKKTKIPIIVMNNIFSTNKEIHMRYDLKGSTIGRKELPDFDLPNTDGKTIKLSYALKDLDLEKNKQLFFVGVILYIKLG